jgi:outer membrane protein
MKTLVRCPLVALVVLVAAPAAAGKIGFVDVPRAVTSTAEGKAKLKELQDWAIPKEQELHQLQQGVEELRRQAAQQRGVATPEALRRLEEDARDAQRRFEDATRDSQRDLAAKQSELLGEVARRMNQLVTEYGTANEYDAIFIFKGEDLIYLGPSADLTETLVKLYDAKFPYQQ